MAWNGSDQGEAKVKGQGQGKEKVERRGQGQVGSGKHQPSTPSPQPSTLRNGLLAGVIVVALGGAAVWWIGRDRSPSGQRDGRDGARPSQIAEVKPQIATNKVAEAEKVVEKKKVYADMSREEKLKYWRDMYGANPPDNVKPIIYYLENPPQRHFKSKESKYNIFRHTSERNIAALLSVKPGNWMMRPPSYDEDFDRDFAASMADRIEITKEDTEEQRALKEAVIATKKEFAERIKAGETPSEIMNEAAKELYSLGQFKRELEIEIGKIRRDPNVSDDDYSLSVEAANKMLENKGLPPMRQVSIFQRQCSLQRQIEKNRKKEMNKEAK